MEENNEISNTLTEMIDSKSTEDIKLAVDIIRNQPDIINKDDLRGHWYNIDNLITKHTIKYTELYYTNGGNSDKVYIIILNSDSKAIWVDAFYGKRGKKLVNRVIYYANNIFLQRAEICYDDIIKSKLKKGYIII